MICSRVSVALNLLFELTADPNDLSASTAPPRMMTASAPLGDRDARDPPPDPRRSKARQSLTLQSALRFGSIESAIVSRRALAVTSSAANTSGDAGVPPGVGSL